MRIKHGWTPKATATGDLTQAGTVERNHVVATPWRRESLC